MDHTILFTYLKIILLQYFLILNKIKSIQTSSNCQCSQPWIILDTTASVQNATINHILRPEWRRGAFLNPWILCGHSLKLKIKIGETGGVLNERSPHPFQLANPNKHRLKNTDLYRVWNMIILIIIVINSFFFFWCVKDQIFILIIIVVIKYFYFYFKKKISAYY